MSRTGLWYANNELVTRAFVNQQTYLGGQKHCSFCFNKMVVDTRFARSIIYDGIEISASPPTQNNTEQPRFPYLLVTFPFFKPRNMFYERWICRIKIKISINNFTSTSTLQKYCFWDHITQTNHLKNQAPAMVSVPIFNGIHPRTGSAPGEGSRTCWGHRQIPRSAKFRGKLGWCWLTLVCGKRWKNEHPMSIICPIGMLVYYGYPMKKRDTNKNMGLK